MGRPQDKIPRRRCHPITCSNSFDMTLGRNFDPELQGCSEKKNELLCHMRPLTAHGAGELPLLVLLKRWAGLPLTFLLDPSLFMRSSSHRTICFVPYNVSQESRLCFFPRVSFYRLHKILTFMNVDSGYFLFQGEPERGFLTLSSVFNSIKNFRASLAHWA